MIVVLGLLTFLIWLVVCGGAIVVGLCYLLARLIGRAAARRQGRRRP